MVLEGGEANKLLVSDGIIEKIVGSSRWKIRETLEYFGGY
jgi:hypothetical protein